MLGYIIILFVVVLAVSIANGLIEISIENKFGKDCSNSFTIGVISGFGSALLIAIPVAIMIDKTTPSAIDVYRNNTELKIQHVIENNDTIQSDTTVIWKEYGK
jgi:hypothetical protein